MLAGGHFAAFANQHTPALTDTLTLHEVEVTAARTHRPRIASDGSTSFESDALSTMPRTFGEIDALRFIRYLPGVTSSSDYSAGFSVDGMDYSQNLYRLNDIPIHFPYHFGGIFSAFSPYLYSNVRLQKSIKNADESGTLGAVVNLQSPYTTPQHITAGINAGMIASSTWIAAPLGSRGSICGSGRISYIDALYKSMLHSNSTQASYNLADLDVCSTYNCSDNDILRATFHYNGDRVKYLDMNYSLTTALSWHNLAAGLEWKHSTTAIDMTNLIYYTRFHNLLHLDMGQIGLDAPTSIDEWGLKGHVSINGTPSYMELAITYGTHLYSVQPQWVEIIGIGQNGMSSRNNIYASENAVAIEGCWHLPYHWAIRTGMIVNIFHSDDNYTVLHPDIRLSATRSWRLGSITLHAGRYHQYLHQVGFSDLGMSSNFKLAASRQIPPQQSLTTAIAGNFHPIDQLYLSADLYYKRVTNQPEYLGGVLDILNSGYRAENYILLCHGYNTGINISARMDTPKINAMATYSYTYTRRYMPGEPIPFAATNELRHCTTLSAQWFIGNHLSVNGVFNLASGRPYTPITAIYFIGEHLMTEYGHRNSARLPLYHRLDLGATYSFTTGGKLPLKHEVNISIINAYGHHNIELTKFSFNADNGTYSRHNVSSLYRFLPSLSYTVSF